VAISKTAVIHPTAIISPQSEIADNARLGAFTIVEADVVVSRGCNIASNVLLASGARLGSECKVAHGAVIGTPPQDLKFRGEVSEVTVGDRTVIREYCTLNRGTEHGHKLTRVGSDCFLMAYCHIAHDCSLGDNVILANCVQLAGHVEIGGCVSIGGMTAVHQFCKIGQHAFLGGMLRVTQDVPPFILTAGEPPAYYGPNRIGLRRRGFTDLQVNSIKQAYHFIYRARLSRAAAVEKIKSELDITAEIQIILDFLEKSNRGLIGLGIGEGSADS